MGLADFFERLGGSVERLGEGMTQRAAQKDLWEMRQQKTPLEQELMQARINQANTSAALNQARMLGKVPGLGGRGGGRGRRRSGGLNVPGGIPTAKGLPYEINAAIYNLNRGIQNKQITPEEANIRLDTMFQEYWKKKTAPSKSGSDGLTGAVQDVLNKASGGVPGAGTPDASQPTKTKRFILDPDTGELK